MSKAATGKRAVGLIRVSRLGGRDKNDGLHSPATQRERIEDECHSRGWKLDEVLDENEGTNGALRDASGAKSLAERPKLREAVERIEAPGGASVLVVAYADRLTWTLSVRDEVLDRVEAAGGEVWSADFGQLSNGTPVDEFTGTSLTAARRLVIRQAAEKARAAQVETVAAGTWMAGTVPLGYVLAADRKLTPDPTLAPVVREAFELRAGGATIDEVQGFLLERGVRRTRKGVDAMLRNRVYLGELRFGALANVDAYAGIVDRATFERVQRLVLTRGRQPKSRELLARLGVLRCASCDGRMSVTTSNYRYRAYRCGNAECERRLTISGPLAEKVVVDAVKAALADLKGRASVEQDAREAAEAVDLAERELGALNELLDPFDPGAPERLQAAREKLSAVRDHAERLGGLSASLTITAADWDRLGFDARRELIRATVARAVVRPGRGPERVSVELVGE